MEGADASRGTKASGGPPRDFHPINAVATDDVQRLSSWEYWLQLSFFTADLHVVRAWSLVETPQETAFSAQAKALRGPIVYSWIDMNKLNPPQSFGAAMKANFFSVGWEQQIFPTGASEPPSGFASNHSGVYRLLLCKVAVGRSLVYHNDAPNHASDSFETARIPEAYTSLVKDEWTKNKSDNHFRQLYRVKREEQVLPTAIVEFEMKPLRIEVSQPVCEMCEVLPATIYCPADRAHLCDGCDERHHATSRLLSRHRRLPATQSPYQFGLCPNHPSEMIDCVCMTCYKALCPHCILIGHHSGADFTEHPLISTVEAYKMSMQGNSPSEEALEARRRTLLSNLTDRHKQLAQLHSKFSAIQDRIGLATKNLIGQAVRLKDKKTGYLQSIKRELLSELLIIEWMEAFFYHLRLSLNPAQFLLYKKKHDLLASHWFGGDLRIKVDVNSMPSWIMERIVVAGCLNVTSDTSLPVLTTSRRVADPDLLKFFVKKSRDTGNTVMEINDPDSESDTDTESDDDSKPYHGGDSGTDRRQDVERRIRKGVIKAEWKPFPSEVDGTAPCKKVPPHLRVLIHPDDQSDAKTSLGNAVPMAREYESSEVHAAPPEGKSSAPVEEVLKKEEGNQRRKRYFPVMDDNSLGDAAADVAGRAGIFFTSKKKDTETEFSRWGSLREGFASDGAIEQTDAHRSAALVAQFAKPKELVREVWSLLCDASHAPALCLFKSCSAAERPSFVASLCDVANSFCSLEDLIRQLIKTELRWLSTNSDGFPSSLLEHVSTILAPLLTHVLSCKRLLLAADRRWQQQIISPLVASSKQACIAHGIDVGDWSHFDPGYAVKRSRVPKLPADEGEDDEIDHIRKVFNKPLGGTGASVQARTVSPSIDGEAAKEVPREKTLFADDMLFPVVGNFIDTLVTLQLSDIPMTLRAIYYVVADEVDSRILQKSVTGRGPTSMGGGAGRTSINRVPMSRREAQFRKKDGTSKSRSYCAINPENRVSAAAVSICCNILMAYLVGSNILRLDAADKLFPTHEDDEDGSEVDYGADHSLVTTILKRQADLQAQIKEAKEKVDDLSKGPFAVASRMPVTKEEKESSTDLLFLDGRASSKQLISALKKRRIHPLLRRLYILLREVAEFTWDGCVREQQQRKMLLLMQAHDGVEADNEELRESSAKRTCFLMENASKLSTWMSSLLHRPRIVSPMKFDVVGQPEVGERAVHSILKYLLYLDKRLREGEYTGGSGGVSVQELTSSYNFEELVALAVKQEQYAKSSR